MLKHDVLVTRCFHFQTQFIKRLETLNTKMQFHTLISIYNVTNLVLICIWKWWHVVAGKLLYQKDGSTRWKFWKEALKCTKIVFGEHGLEVFKKS